MKRLYLIILFGAMLAHTIESHAQCDRLDDQLAKDSTKILTAMTQSNKQPLRINLGELQFGMYKCEALLMDYISGGYAIQIIDINDSFSVAILTVWLEGIPENHIAVNVNLQEDTVQILKDHNIIQGEPYKTIRSGFVTYPVYKLSDKVIAMIEPKYR